MAILPGYKLSGGTEYARTNPNTITLDNLGGYLFEERKASTVVTIAASVSYTFGAPAVIVTPYGGAFMPGFAGDWYNTVHLIPGIIAFGNIFQPTTRPIVIWNAFRSPQVVSSITYGVANAVVLNVLPNVVPYTSPALRLGFFQVETLETAPTIFDFFIDYSLGPVVAKIRVSGRQLIFWGLAPETGHSETLEWKTDLIATYGTEQRISIREAPRQSFDYDYILDEEEFVEQKTLAAGGAGLTYGIPNWTDAVYIGAITSGQTVFAADFNDYEFHVGGLVAVYFDDGSTHITEVDELTAGSLTLRLPVVNSATQGFLAPLRTAQSVAGPQFSRTSNRYVKSQIKFAVTNNQSYLKDAAPVTYRGLDVLITRYAVVGSVNERIYKMLDVLDNGSSTPVLSLKDSKLRNGQTIGFVYQSRADKRIFRSWLMKRKGRLVPFWLPSWNNEVTIVANVALNAGSLIIKRCDFTFAYGSSPKFLMVVLQNGTFVFLHVVSAAYIQDEDQEILTLGTLCPANILVADVKFVCFLSHCRLDTDSIKISHGDAGKLSTSIPVMEIPE